VKIVSGAILISGSFHKGYTLHPPYKPSLARSVSL
jgi:hypothetical protein